MKEKGGISGRSNGVSKDVGVGKDKELSRIRTQLFLSPESMPTKLYLLQKNEGYTG